MFRIKGQQEKNGGIINRLRSNRISKKSGREPTSMSVDFPAEYWRIQQRCQKTQEEQRRSSRSCDTRYHLPNRSERRYGRNGRTDSQEAI